MANKPKSKKAAPKKSDENVVRIKASSSAPKPKARAVAAEAAVETVKSKPAKPAKTKTKRTAPRAKALRASGGYFKGAWVELRQVRWPNRRATWGLTGAVLAYSAFFVIIVLLLDAGFKYLFDLVLK